MDNLPLLKDIHLPEPVTRFPLGYGVIIFLIFLTLFILCLPFLKKLYLKSKKMYALNFIRNLNEPNIQNLCLISEMLRRICKLKYQSAVSLYGQNWASFLNQKSSIKLPKNQMDLFINAPYAPKNIVVTKSDFELIQKFAVSFAEANL